MFPAVHETKLEAHPEIREMISVFVHQVRYRPKGYYVRVEKNRGNVGGGGVTSLQRKKMGGPVCDLWFGFVGTVCFGTKRVPISSTENIPRSRNWGLFTCFWKKYLFLVLSVVFPKLLQWSSIWKMRSLLVNQVVVTFSLLADGTWILQYSNGGNLICWCYLEECELSLLVGSKG